MIKKILKISGVGRFKSFGTGNDDYAFDKTTIIFGYNTHGKSTLTSIFRSLKDNNPRYIHGRKTFGFTDTQEVEIAEESNNKFVFPTKWENKNIEIFDNKFISDNVFYGEEIGKEQKANLYRIFLSDEVKQDIDSLEKDIEEKKKLDQSKNDIPKQYPWDFTPLIPFESFVNLPEESLDDINRQILEKDKEAKQQENLSQLKFLLSRNAFKIDFENIEKKMEESLDSRAEETIKEHIEKTSNDPDHSQNFLREGVSLLRDEKEYCVFCGQSIKDGSAKELISKYISFFSGSYERFKSDISNIESNFLNVDVERELLKFEKLGISLDSCIKNKEALTNSKKNIDKIISEKKNNLNLSVNLAGNGDFLLVKNDFNEIANYIEGKKQELDQVKDSHEMEKERKMLRIKKARFSEDWIKNVLLYKNISAKVKVLSETINQKSADVSRKVESIFDEHNGNINTFLEEMRMDFKIEKIIPKEHKGAKQSHFCEYEFSFGDENVIPVSNKRSEGEQEPEDKYYFGNTLSDSDRRALAFAFFLSKLKKDVNLGQKIVVFDDPFSSFDENRKPETIRLLMNIKNGSGNEPAQKIILTHDKGFLCRLCRDFPNDMKTLKIHYSQTDGSGLQPCDVENDFTKEDFFKDLEYIQNSSQTSTNVKEALKKARPCLEHILKRKYYFLLAPDTLKRKSVGEYLAEIGAACSAKQEILSDNWHEDMHDNHPIMQLNEPAQISKLTRLLELIKEV